MFATSGTTGAHTPTVKHTCSELSFVLVSYEGPAANNTVTVTIDGKATTFPFANALSKTFPWSQAADHTYSVAIDANILHGDAVTFDKTFTGSQEHCPVVTSTTTSTTTLPTTAATTTTAPPATDATTTTAPPAPEVTTTTAVASEAPIVATTTTTPAAAALATAPGVAVEAPVPALSPAAANVVLPATGSNTGLELGLALAAVLAGIGLLTFTRRYGRNAGTDG